MGYDADDRWSIELQPDGYGIILTAYGDHFPDDQLPMGLISVGPDRGDGPGVVAVVGTERADGDGVDPMVGFVYRDGAEAGRALLRLHRVGASLAKLGV
jgi:hypothetical protein